MLKAEIETHIELVDRVPRREPTSQFRVVLSRLRDGGKPSVACDG